MYQVKPESHLSTTDADYLYPYVNNDIEYGLFEDIVDSYYLDSQIRDDFQCDQDCYSQYMDLTNDDHSNMCMLGSIYKLAPFINGAAPFSSLKMEQPFINRAAPFSSILSCSVYKWSCSIFKQLCQTYNNHFMLKFI